MRGALLVTALVACISTISAEVRSDEVQSMSSVKVDLPSSDRQFPGDGADADAINNNCLACHSAAMVLNQPALPKAIWESEVKKMVRIYKAPIDDGDVDLIVAYLARKLGAP
jgi:hypothetical protein